MSDTMLPVIAAALTALKANATLTALVPAARMYTNVPDNPTFPFLMLSISSAPLDTKTSNGMQHTLQVSAFSRKPTPSEVGAIRSAVYSALHKNETAFSSVPVFSIMFSGVSPVLKETDGQTWNCPMQFSVLT